MCFTVLRKTAAPKQKLSTDYIGTPTVMAARSSQQQRKDVFCAVRAEML
jgi:hypothetical protein